MNAEANRNIMKCYTTTGDGSHLLLVKVENTESLEKLLRTIQSWPGVSRTQTQIVLSSYSNPDSSTSIKR
jgi:Lrp/AsnC family leucine-responsive transcriptional regulator